MKKFVPAETANTSSVRRKRVALVAATTGYQTRMFEEAANAAGIELVLATDRCHVLDDPWGDHAVPIRFETPDTAGAILGTSELEGIVAVGDRPALVAAVAAAELGLRFHPPDAVAACENKFTAREQFRDAGLLVPGFYRVSTAEQPSTARFHPCVLKPLGLSASRGVIRANNNDEFAAAFRRIRAIIEHEELNDFIHVERFIDGREFALEGIVSSGRLDVIALFDKPDPLDGPYFEETIYVTPSREPLDVQTSIAETTQTAIRALGLTDGPVHAEMRVNQAGVWMLEVAARPIGGLCAKAIPGLEELILRHAVGEKVTIAPPNTASGVMMIPIPREGIYHGVSGVEDAQAVPGVTEVIITAKEGQRIVPLPEGKSYLGFIFARGSTPADVEHALRYAHQLLSFDFLGALPVIHT